ncbi:ATP-binding cassette domain-containing protein [Marinobacter bryozoorum]|uniref:amino acid ABC transporter ATP-binding/permease protein n=1 Tax=Marinobacter bryozoorum TaxID=256324 RepID=UPI0020046678|nr:ATP-binding cassette domain-containing protein [Marinobacter bryozoorum]MCK7543047.1 ATP-binding cassette domain-containing protein [Marinobacter bryozoorum]
MNELRPWLRLLAARWQRLVIGGLLIFATILAGVGLLALSGWFITATALTGLLLVAGVAAQLDIYTPGGGIRFFALARTVSRYLERVYNHDTVLRLLADVRVALFTRLALAHPGKTATKRPADWLNRLVADVDAMDTLYLQLIAPSGLALAGLLLAAFVMALVAPPLLWSLAPLTMLPMVLYLLARRTFAPSRNQGEQTEALRGRFVDALEGNGELRAAQLWSPEAIALLRDSRTLDTTRLLVEQQTAIANGVSLLAIQLASLTAMLIGLSLWQSGELSGPVALLFTLAVLGLGEAFTGLPAAFSRFGTTLGAAARLNDEGAIHTPEQAGKPAPGPGPLQLTDFIVEQNGEALIQPLSLQLPANGRLAILGRSGSGKSSLLDCLAGINHNWRGELQLSGHSAESVNIDGWRANISYLTQRTHLFNDTIAANLRMAKPDATDQDLHRILDAVALTPLLETLPDGIHSMVGEQGRTLSGGERRRLALARALLRPSGLLLLDEPFTGVDAATTRRICTAIEPWLSCRTCVFAGHAVAVLPNTGIYVNLDEYQ